MSLSRAELAAMDEEEIIETVNDLAETVDNLEVLLHTQIEKRKDLADRVDELEQRCERLDQLEQRLEQVDATAHGALQATTGTDDESKTDLAKRLTQNMLVVRAAKNTEAADRPVTVSEVQDRADEHHGTTLAWSLVDHAWDSLREEWPQFHETEKRGKAALSIRPSKVTKPLVGLVEADLDRDDLTKRFFGGNGGTPP